MKIAVTGHRPHKLNNEYDHDGPCSKFISAALIKFLTEKKATLGISGMALGADTLFTQACIDLKIPVLAAIPFYGQESRWPKASRDRYFNLLSNPLVTTHYVTEGSYSSAAMQLRNEYMVDECDYLIAVYDGTRGGTFNTVRYAQSKDHNIHLIDPTHWNKLDIDQGKLF